MLTNLNFWLMVGSVMFGAWSEYRYGWFAALEVFIVKNVIHGKNIFNKK